MLPKEQVLLKFSVSDSSICGKAKLFIGEEVTGRFLAGNGVCLCYTCKSLLVEHRSLTTQEAGKSIHKLSQIMYVVEMRYKGSFIVYLNGH